MRKLPLREVRLSADYVTDYKTFQLNYLDRTTMKLFPNTKVYSDGELLVEVNSLGCFGPEPPEAVPLIAVLGDSVIQGMHHHTLVDYVTAPGCAAINGGVEGSPLDYIIGRFEDLRATGRLICAVVHPGFHNLLYSETSFIWWENQFCRLTGVPVVALIKLSADIHPDAVAAGYEKFYGEDYGETFFSQPKNIKNLQAAIDRKNQLIDRVCAQRGFLAIDLDPILKPRTLAEVATRFFDVIHPRHDMYPQIGQAISAAIASHVAKALRDGFAGAVTGVASVTPPQTGAAEAMQKQGRNYPLW